MQNFPKIPGYKLLDLLGRGSMGTVYRAYQTALDRMVAIKVLHPRLAAQKKYLYRLQREAKLTARLDHPNVVKGIDCGIAEGHAYFVMEYAEGKTLKQIFKERGRFPEKEALAIALQLAGALEHAYQHGIVHRDVKPSNVIVNSAGKVKLTDLGLARRPGDPTITHQGGTVGTPQYISPEQARNPTNVDVRSDIYSLGATLYHLVTGAPPFAGESLADVLTKVLFEREKSPNSLVPSITAGFSLVLQKMLAKEPSKRYLTPSLLIRDLKLVAAAKSPLISDRSLQTSQPWTLNKFIGIAAASILLFGLTWYGLREESTDTASGVASAEVTTPFANLSLKTLPVPKLLELAAGIDQYQHTQLSEAAAFKVGQIADSVRQELVLRLTGAQQLIEKTLEANLLATKYDKIPENSVAAYTSLLSLEWKYDSATPNALPSWLIQDIDIWARQQRERVARRLQAIAQKAQTAFMEDCRQAEKTVDMHLSANHFQSALSFINNHFAKQASADGNAQSNLALLESYKAIATFLHEQKSKIADLTAQVHSLARNRLQDLIAQIKDLAAHYFKESKQNASAELFEQYSSATADLIAKHNIDRAQLPAEQALLLQSLLDKYSQDLQLIIEDARLALMNSIIEDFAKEQAALYAARQYAKALTAWQSFAEKVSMPAAKRKIDIRQEELVLLLGLYDQFAKNLDTFLGESVRVREGSIWKEGILRTRFDKQLGQFVIQRQDSTEMVVAFADIHEQSIGQICGILTADNQLTDLNNEQRCMWGVFLFYEKKYAAAQQVLKPLLLDESFPYPLTQLLQRLELAQQQAVAQSKARDVLAREQYAVADKLFRFREWDHAEARLKGLVRQFAETSFVQDNRGLLKERLFLIDSLRQEELNEQKLQAAFPGAKITQKPQGELLLQYDLRTAQHAGGWTVTSPWEYVGLGVQRSTRCEDEKSFRQFTGPHVELPIDAANAFTIHFSVFFPYEANPYLTCFHAMGINFVVLCTPAHTAPKVVAWQGSINDYFANSSAKISATAKFHFLHGAKYQVTLQWNPAAQEMTFFVDGEAIANLHMGKSLSSAKLQRIELRDWGRVILQEVDIQARQFGTQ